MKTAVKYEVLDVYEVTITPVRYGGSPAFAWKVVCPDGEVVSGTTHTPGWRWMARRAALKAARWHAHKDDLGETYKLKRMRPKED